jgi:hypothetical protein
MALMGMDIHRMLTSASATMAESAVGRVTDNPAAMLGVSLGEAYRSGRDKLSLFGSSRIRTFGYWSEQLVAESTGKDAKGILPIEGEGFKAALSRHPEKRIFVFSILRGEEESLAVEKKALESAGHPYAVIVLDDVYELGGEFFRWEFATAVAAAVMQLNPFDEPNVKESKDNTNAMIAEFTSRGRLPLQNKIAENEVMAFYGESTVIDASGKNPADILRAYLSSATADSYCALLAYIDQNKANEDAMTILRDRVGALAGTPTTVGFGPRYLHSTGQLHKGGAAKGIFLIITAEEMTDIAIPGEAFTFKVLNEAQALGDARSLVKHGLPLLRIHLKSEPLSGIQTIISLLS